MVPEGFVFVEGGVLISPGLKLLAVAFDGEVD
jgi:hypothetical protein